MNSGQGGICTVEISKWTISQQLGDQLWRTNRANTYNNYISEKWWDIFCFLFLFHGTLFWGRPVFDTNIQQEFVILMIHQVCSKPGINFNLFLWPENELTFINKFILNLTLISHN